MEKYLVLNAGSSSLKFSLYLVKDENVIVSGLIERIGQKVSNLIIKNYDKKEVVAHNHRDAVKLMLDTLIDYGYIASYDEINGIGHRILHGGEYYHESVIIDELVLSRIKELTPLGPLHHPGEIAGIEALKELLPNIPQVATFDTAFHQTIPDFNFRYAVNEEWYTKYGVRKYGFHGTSHKYINEKLKKIHGSNNYNAIICHIGNGASVSCIKKGQCYNTTMGLTPEAGLIMGTRCGDIDPSIISYISTKTNMSASEIDYELNNHSGLYGLCGYSDFRDVIHLVNEKDEKGLLAYKKYLLSIANFIANYDIVDLEGKVDYLVFTAGVGENVPRFRSDVINLLKALKINIDDNKNNNNEENITGKNSSVNVFVFKTDEELMIVRDMKELIK